MWLGPGADVPRPSEWLRRDVAEGKGRAHRSCSIGKSFHRDCSCESRPAWYPVPHGIPLRTVFSTQHRTPASHSGAWWPAVRASRTCCTLRVARCALHVARRLLTSARCALRVARCLLRVARNRFARSPLRRADLVADELQLLQEHRLVALQLLLLLDQQHLLALDRRELRKQRRADDSSLRVRASSMERRAPHLARRAPAHSAGCIARAPQTCSFKISSWSIASSTLVRSCPTTGAPIEPSPPISAWARP
jgi:hypothetical protein